MGWVQNCNLHIRSSSHKKLLVILCKGCTDLVKVAIVLKWQNFLKVFGSVKQETWKKKGFFLREWPSNLFWDHVGYVPYVYEHCELEWCLQRPHVFMDADWPWKPLDLISGASHLGRTIEILTCSTIIKNYCHYLRFTWFTPPGPRKNWCLTLYKPIKGNLSWMVTALCKPPLFSSHEDFQCIDRVLYPIENIFPVCCNGPLSSRTLP